MHNKSFHQRWIPSITVCVNTTKCALCTYIFFSKNTITSNQVRQWNKPLVNSLRCFPPTPCLIRRKLVKTAEGTRMVFLSNGAWSSCNCLFGHFKATTINLLPAAKSRFLFQKTTAFSWVWRNFAVPSFWDTLHDKMISTRCHLELPLAHPHTTQLDSTNKITPGFLLLRQHNFTEPGIPRTFGCIILQCEHCQPMFGNLVNCGATYLKTTLSLAQNDRGPQWWT